MEMKKTITSIFMVPTLKIPKGKLKDNEFINGYATDEMKDSQYKDSIYLLFRPTCIDKFREFLDSEYERTKSIIDDYDYPNGFVVVVYKLDTKYKDDFDLIRESKYSKTSVKFQSEFPKTILVRRKGTAKEEISLQYRIFNKTEDLITFWEEKFDVQFDDEQELWHGFDPENEALTQDVLDNLLKEEEVKISE